MQKKKRIKGMKKKKTQIKLKIYNCQCQKKGEKKKAQKKNNYAVSCTKTVHEMLCRFQTSKQSFVSQCDSTTTTTTTKDWRFGSNAGNKTNSFIH